MRREIAAAVAAVIVAGIITACGSSAPAHHPAVHTTPPGGAAAVPVLRVNANGGYYGVVTRAPGFATVAKTAAWICRQDQAQLGAQLLRLGAPGGIGGGHMLYIVDLYGPAGPVKGPVPVNVTLTAGDFAPLSDSDGLCAVPVSSP